MPHCDQIRYLARVLVCLAVLAAQARAQEADEKAASPAPADQAATAELRRAGASVEQLVETVRKSVVVITYTGRDGQREGLGTGFVVGADGLIATNLHVIGEARPISVETSDGKRYDVDTVHASDRSLDLALVRIAATDLPALELGDSDSLKQGQAVVAVGNPLGLTHSVVSGVVSGQREIDGRSWIQLAIPIEPGNSGGPLLDMQGRVHGLLTMKSLVTANLGFAVPINHLKPLLEKPNPIPIERWLTIGAMDQRQWTPLMGARWRRRAGHITVEGAGAGFGGRSLCLSQLPPPQVPYELAVTVRLDNEAGAAGLAFASDGGDKHFGFYPSAGNLRLSRFEGPDVNSWQVVRDEPSPHYRPGDWNTLKVRVEADKVLCYVNSQLVFEEPQAVAADGRVGLAKFRNTKADFKNFQLGPEIPSNRPAEDVVARVQSLVADIAPTGPPAPLLVDELSKDKASMIILAERARHLEQQARQLRQLAQVVHQKQVLAELAEIVKADDQQLDLFHAALLIARLDNSELDVESYRQELERMAGEIASTLPQDADDAARLAALNGYLFETNGFHGSRGDYDNRANSYVNEVLEDREGLPITLSLVYMELARRIGLTVVGIGLPGHFVVAHVPAEGERQLIDVFEGGKPISREDARQKVLAISGLELQAEHLEPVSERALLVRMLHNLRGLAGRSQDLDGMLRYLDAILLIDTDSAEDRWFRALFRHQSGQSEAALEDLEWLEDHAPPGIDPQNLGELRRRIEQSVPQNR